MKNRIKVREYWTYRLEFGLFLKLPKLMCANEAFRIILLQDKKIGRIIIIFLAACNKKFQWENATDIA